MSSGAGWSVSLSEIAERMKAELELVARKVTFELFKTVQLRSPVGNPDNWKANAGARYRRDTHNLFVEAHNDAVLSNSASYGASGALRKGVSLGREKSNKALHKMFPNVAGKGYVGGRFRANWNVSTGAPVTTTTDDTQQNRSDAEIARVMTLPIGTVTYLSNGLPYGVRLEHGWSKQAPSGMVKLSVAEFDLFIKKAIRK